MIPRRLFEAVRDRDGGFCLMVLPGCMGEGNVLHPDLHLPQNQPQRRGAAMSGRAMGSHQSARADTTTWLTPPDLIEKLGPFDLDPCAAPSPRPWPTAARHIELPEDGLAAEREGHVWLNPPYSFAAWKWLDKLAMHGDGIALIFARTETAGFVEQVWGKATGVLFLHGRLYFHRPDGTRAAANSGAPSCLVAYGQRARSGAVDDG